MKRPIIETVSTYGESEINSTSMMKRRRNKLNHNCMHSRRSPSVRFATPLVQEMQIPAVVDKVEKERLFYSHLDFARFAFNERVRRDALVLTITLCREQTKRMSRGASAIPATSVLLMYHKILSRTEDTSRLLEKEGTVPTRKVHRLAPSTESKSKLRHRIMTARTA